MQALPARSEFLTVTVVVRIPGKTWDADDAANLHPRDVIRHGRIMFGAVESGITDEAIRAGAEPTSWPAHA